MKKNLLVSILVIAFLFALKTTALAADDSGCNNLGGGYSCQNVTDQNKDSLSCLADLCLSNSDSRYLCCKPSNSSSICPSDETFLFLNTPIYTCPKAGINSFISVGVAVTRFILGITGSLALLAFIWGGFKMLISRGESKTVQEGKDAIKAAVIGIFIVFTSYSIIQFILQSAGMLDGSGNFKINDPNASDITGQWNVTPK